MNSYNAIEDKLIEEAYKRLWMIVNIIKNYAILSLIKTLIYLTISVAMIVFIKKIINYIFAIIKGFIESITPLNMKRNGIIETENMNKNTLNNPYRKELRENVKIFLIKDDFTFRQIMKRSELQPFIIDNIEEEDSISKLTKLGQQNFIINDITMIPEWYDRYVMCFDDTLDCHKEKRVNIIPDRTAYIIGRNNLEYVINVLKTHIKANSPFSIDKIYINKVEGK